MQKTCNYCHAIYTPRPQVKNPKACNKPICQKKRQSANELDWQRKNKNLYDKKYHQIKRSKRLKEVDLIVNIIWQSLLTGLRFHGFSLNSNAHFFTQIIASIGLRQLNKLYFPSSP